MFRLSCWRGGVDDVFYSAHHPGEDVPDRSYRRLADPASCFNRAGGCSRGCPTHIATYFLRGFNDAMHGPAGRHRDVRPNITSATDNPFGHLLRYGYDIPADIPNPHHHALCYTLHAHR